MRGGAEVIAHAASHISGGGLARHVEVSLPTCSECARDRRRAKLFLRGSIVLFFASMVGIVVIATLLMPMDDVRAEHLSDLATPILLAVWCASIIGWTGAAAYRWFIRSKMYVSYVGHKGFYYTFALRSTAQDFADSHAARVEHRPIVFELY
jgi:hypothetical protein